MIINTNTSSTLASYNLSSTNRDHQRNLNKLSSGLRINSSYDDAAGLAVSMKMNAQIRRADAYAANVGNSLSFLQTQDGALKQLGNLLQRMSELKALAHDVTKNSGDLELYEKEYIQLQEQFAQITTEKFNGINLFSPTSTPDPLFVSHPERGDTIQVSRPALGDLNTGDTLKAGESSFSIPLGEFFVPNLTSAKAFASFLGGRLAVIDSPEKQLAVEHILPTTPGMRFYIGLSDEQNEGNYLWSDGSSLTYSNWAVDQPDAPSNDSDATVIHNEGFNIAARGQWGIVPTSLVLGFVLEKTNSILSIAWSDLHSTIQQVANARAQNGAEQSQLQMAADLNSTNIGNMEQALSRIQDVDIAQVTSDLARTKVLIEAGTAMLAQANQSTDSILKLIMQN